MESADPLRDRLGDFASPSFLFPFIVFGLLLFLALTCRPISLEELDLLAAPRGGLTGATPFPPLYGLLLLALRAAAGTSGVVLRVVSVLIALASLPLWFRVARRFFGASAWMPFWLLATSSLLVFAAPLAVPHALALFLTALATDRFLLLLERPTRRRWIAYGIILGLSIYTFYLAFAMMAAQLVVFALAWRREPRRLLPPLVVLLAVTLSFAPWLLAAGPGGVSDGEAGPAGAYVGLLQAVYAVYAFAAGDGISPFALPLSAAVVVFFGILVVLGIIRIQSGRTIHRHLLVAMVGLTLLFLFPVYALGLASRPLRFDPAPLAFVVPFFFFILSCGLVSVKDRRIRRVAFGAVIAVQAVSLLNFYTGRQWSSWTYVVPSRKIAAYLSENATSNDLVLLNTLRLGEGIGRGREGKPRFRYYEEPARALPPELESANRVWLVRRILDGGEKDRSLDPVAKYLGLQFVLDLQASRKYVKEPLAIYGTKRRWAKRLFGCEVYPYKIEALFFERPEREK